MSEDEKAKAEQAERAGAALRGHFESVDPDYPGFFELPHPFLDRHMKLWWAFGVEPLKALSTFDFDFYDGEWKAAVELIQKYGKWSVDGVPEGDLDGDNVPSKVKAWALQEASAYIYPLLPFSIRRKLLGIM